MRSLASSAAASELCHEWCLRDLEQPLDLDLDLVLEREHEGVRLRLLPRGGVLESDQELRSPSEELLSSLILKPRVLSLPCLSITEIYLEIDEE